MLPFPKFVKMEIDEGTFDCHYDSSKSMQIYHIRMQIWVKSSLFKISISIQYNAFKGHIFNCGITNLTFHDLKIEIV
jgi:hypothetical protein